MSRFRLWSVLLLIPVCSLFAQLQWDKKEIEMTPQYGDALVETSYTFKNVGKKTITIVQVQPSCGCTTAQLSKRTYDPGESGAIDVKMSVDPSGGERRKTIFVRTDEKEPADNSYVLIIASKTKELAKMSNRLLVWMNQEEIETRTITVTMLSDKAKIARADSSSDRFRVKLGPLEDGKYTISITPVSTELAASARISILLNYPAEHPAEYYAYARVSGPPLKKVENTTTVMAPKQDPPAADAPAAKP